MKRGPRAVADRSTGPLRILLVEDVAGRTEFVRRSCKRPCTVRRLSDVTQAIPLLRTSLFHVLIVNQSPATPSDWTLLQQLEKDFPSVEIIVFTDAEPATD